MRKIVFSMLGTALCAALLSPATMASTSKDDKQLQAAAHSIDTQAAGQGQQAVMSRLETLFSVDATRIDGLRSQGLGFGEVAIVLTLAQKMSGGITDTNVQSITAMRTGTPPMGWGEIANKLGEKLGPLVSQVNTVARGTRPDVGASGHGDGASRPDKPDRPDRPEHPQKPEHPEPPQHP